MHTMGTHRITISLSSRAVSGLRRESRELRKPISRIVADLIEDHEEERLAELMREGYREFSDLNRELAEEFWPIAAETLPDD